jgi:hypothetical protein
MMPVLSSPQPSHYMTRLFDETVHELYVIMDKDSEQEEDCSNMLVVAVMLCLSYKMTRNVCNERAIAH